MSRRRGPAGLWKLLLPFLLAAIAMVLLALAVSRTWEWAPVPRSTAREPAKTGSPQEPQRPAVSATDSPAAATREGLRPSLPSAGVDSPFAPSTAPDLPRPSLSPVEIAPPPATPTRDKPIPTALPEPMTITKPAADEIAVAPTGVSPSLARAARTLPPSQPALVPAPEPQTSPTSPSIAPPHPSEPLRSVWAEGSVRSVRFDAGYYYGRGLSARQLADELTRSWADKGVNLVYFYAYNRVYGARYRTQYPGNIMEDYGRQDLLGHMLRAAHSRGIKVIAWLAGVQHKHMWEAHPDWRQKTADGRDYRPDQESYLLCVRNPEVMSWWLALIDDLVTSYPDLDGVDIAESQIDLWGDHACYCDRCRAQFAQAHPGEAEGRSVWRRFRAEGLTRVLVATNRLVKSYGKQTHLTTVFTARKDGELMPSGVVRDATGFDLEGLLASPHRPDVIQAELIWQQWASIYGDRSTFTPEWTCQAVRQAKDMVRGRARLVCHVEITDFGVGGLDGPKIGQTVAAAVRGGPYGVDIYDAHLLDGTSGATGYLQTAWLNFAQ